MDTPPDSASAAGDSPEASVAPAATDLLALILQRLLEAMPDKCAMVEARAVPARLAGIDCQFVDCAASSDPIEPARSGGSRG